MGRQQRAGNTNEKGEQITVLSEEDHDIELPPADPESEMLRSQVTGDATKKVEATVEAPPVKKYVVVRGGAVLCNGHRTTIKEGKILDSLNYDIAHLQRQGIRLQRAETADLPIID